MRRAGLPKHLSPKKLESLRVSEEVYDLTPLVLENIEHLHLDYLIAIGGDDTLSFAKRLDSKGVRIIGIPKTMDNDVQGTEYCIGFSTAISRAKEAITRQRTTLGSHERIGIFRIFGRDAGFTALYTAYVTAGRCVIPEVEFDLDRLIAILLEDKRNNPSRYAFVIVSEGAVWQGHSVDEYGEADAYGHKKKVDIGHALGEEIRRRTGEEIMVSDLTYDLRSGDPDALDQIVAITFANVAVDLIREEVYGRLTAVRDGKYTHVPLPDPKLGAAHTGHSARCTTSRATDRITPAGSAHRCCFQPSNLEIENAKRDLRARRGCLESAAPETKLFEGRFQKAKGEGQTQAGFL